MSGGLAMLMRIRSGLFRAINGAFPYLGKGCCILMLAVVFIITTELSVSTTWSASTAAIPSMQEVVNRTHKADRLPLPLITRADYKLPIGCESVVSSFP